MRSASRKTRPFSFQMTVPSLIVALRTTQTMPDRM
jgi:hypothetical protein